jgi:hypothetical protein
MKCPSSQARHDDTAAGQTGDLPAICPAARITPFVVNHRDLETLFASPRLCRRLIAAGWIEKVRLGKPGREALYDYESARRAYERFKAGENPPPLLWEKSKRRQP